MNKIEIDNVVVYNIDNDISREIYLYTDSSTNYVFNLGLRSKLSVYQYCVNSSCKIEINLNEENAEVEYHFSTINTSSNNLDIKVNHNKSNTISNIYNHGVNILNNSLHFDVCGKVLKTSSNCVCNQSNQIINLGNGKSTILPKLLIDNYDVNSNHSAYIGKFKDEVVFYLMSRGITKKKAYELLIKGLLINSGNTDNIEVKKIIEQIKNI